MSINNESLNIIISIIWGLGISALFRKICKKNCVVIKSPDNIDTYYKKKKNKCYKFLKENTSCKEYFNNQY